MSQENVEIVRTGFEAWNAGDMEALSTLFDRDAIVARLAGFPESGPFVGREAVMRWFQQAREAWDADAMEPITFVDAGDRVVARMIWRGVGRGPEAKMEFAIVLTMRKGRAFLLEYFWDHAEALETLGLREQPPD